MIDFSTPFGKKLEQRLRDEQVLWLSTVDAQLTPQPRPIWFHWDGETVLIFSQPHAAKVRHIAANPHVALSFNTDADGENVGVLIGKATMIREPVPPERIALYLEKYAEGIVAIKMTPTTLQAEYSLAILVTPLKARGW